jgi:hypothetical protein
MEHGGGNTNNCPLADGAEDTGNPPDSANTGDTTARDSSVDDKAKAGAKATSKRASKGRISNDEAKQREEKDMENVNNVKYFGDPQKNAYIFDISVKRVLDCLWKLSLSGEYDREVKIPKSCPISQVGKVAAGMSGSPFSSNSYVDVELAGDQLILTLVPKLK